MQEKSTPPKFALRLLEWFCPPGLSESIEGDLVEQFEEDSKVRGVRKAKGKFVLNVIKFFRPGIILRNRFSIEFMNITLLLNYFKISYRYLAKHKTFAAVNILGLSLGMAASFLIYEYVRFEKSYDSFHENVSNIYRITTEWNSKQTPDDKRATTVPWSGPNVKEAFPEVIEYSRFVSLSTMTGDNSVRFKDKNISEINIYLADPGFLKIFSFPLLQGNAASALSNPHQVIITKSIAEKYFQKENPIGKSLVIDTHGNLSGNDYLITGVIENPPATSHLTFDFLISYSSMWQGLNNGSTYWHWDNTYCYVLLRPNVNVKSLEKKISDLRVKQFGNEFGDWKDIIDFKLQPLKEIHLYSSLKGEVAMNGDGRSVNFLVIVGIFILLSAYINYINLSTSKALERKTEIGVRKVVGSTKIQLTIQLLVESIVINCFAVMLAVIIAKVSQPILENIFNIHWPVLTLEWITQEFLLTTLCVVFAGILLSTFYPAFVITSFRPVEVLKGSKSSNLSTGNRWTLRQSLTVVQFIFCIGFTTATFALYRQLQFMKSYDLGMNMEKVIAVRSYGFQSYESFQNFKARLSSSSLISSVASSSAAPGDEIEMLGLKPKVRVGNNPELKELKVIGVDEDFFKTLHVDFLSGRNFDTGSKTENDAVILNEAAVQLLGYGDSEKILHQPLHNLTDKESKIVGVIKNYHQRSLKNEYEPIVFVPKWVEAHRLGWNKNYYFVRLNPTNNISDIQKAIGEMETAWKASTSEHPFNYFFLDNYFDSHYKAETTFSSLFLFFSCFAIFISCLGLFGWVAYTTLQRTKEIGIRKVLGASVQNILMLLSKEFVKLILIASILTTPLVLLGLQNWLKAYAFRIQLTIWLFALPLLLIFCLALITVVLKSLKVAISNPVDSIRYE